MERNHQLQLAISTYLSKSAHIEGIGATFRFILDSNDMK